jgi:hypothetical protein
MAEGCMAYRHSLHIKTLCAGRYCSSSDGACRDGAEEEKGMMNQQTTLLIISDKYPEFEAFLRRG